MAFDRKKALETLKTRLVDGRTWKGLTYIAAAALLKVYPEHANEIMIGAFSLSGTIGLFFMESEPVTVPTDPTLENLQPK